MSFVNAISGAVDNVATGLKKSALKNSTALKANLSMAMGKSSDEILESKGVKNGIDKLTKTVSEQQNRKMIRKEIDNSTKNAIKAGKEVEQEAKENIIDKVKNKVSEAKEEVSKKAKETPAEIKSKTEEGQEFSTFLMDFNNPEAGINELHYDANTKINYSEDLKNAKKTSDGGFWDNATTWAGEHPIGTAAAIAGGAFGIGLMVGDDND